MNSTNKSKKQSKNKDILKKSEKISQDFNDNLKLLKKNQSQIISDYQKELEKAKLSELRKKLS